MMVPSFHSWSREARVSNQSHRGGVRTGGTDNDDDVEDQRRLKKKTAVAEGKFFTRVRVVS